MLKLAIVFGVGLTIFCGFMTFRSAFNNSNGQASFQSNNLPFLGDIKQVFGFGQSNSLPFPIPANNDNSGGYSSGGGYLPPKSLRNNLNTEGEPGKNNSNSSSTPTFRIFILPTMQTTTSKSTNEEEATTTMEMATTAQDSSPAEPIPDQLNLMKQSASGEGELINETSTAMPPESSIHTPATTLQPPNLPSNLRSGQDIEKEVSTSENTGVIEENTIPVQNSSSTESPRNNSSTTASNKVYLPPNKEYLPPRQSN